MTRFASGVALVFLLSLGMGCSTTSDPLTQVAATPDASAPDAATPDASVATDGSDAADSAPDAEVCANFPTRIDQDYVVTKGCYLAKQTPVIAAAVRLTIEPGVKIVFSQDVALNFSADQLLIATGTAADPILLTGATKQRGFWKGLSFDGILKPDSRLDYVTVEYAGSTKSDRDGAAVKLTADSRGVRASITHSTFVESQGWGLWLAGSAVVPEFSANTLTKNTLGPVSIASEVTGMLDAASSYAGNDRDQIVVRAYRVAAAATWSVTEVPYALQSGLSIDTDLTLAAGVTLIMTKNTGLTVSGDAGALIAKGTAAKPIRFTGDVAQRGAWNGIIFDGSNNTRNALAYATVEYGGDVTHDADAAGIKLIADSHGVQLAMSQTTVQQSQGWGLYLAGSAVVPSFAGNTLTKNALGPASVGSEAAHQLLATSTYTGNDVDKVLVRANRVANVTWASIGVPYQIAGGLHVDAVWTLDPGVTLVMGPAAWMSVAGDAAGLSAVGTPTKPILITGATKTAGSWESIVFDTTNNPANAFAYCTIEYGGGGTAKGWDGMIFTTSDSHGVTLSITNSTIQHSAVAGISVLPSTVLTNTDNTFADNAGGNLVTRP